MSYYNCGAQLVGSDTRIPTKKRRKQYLSEEPGAVYFDGTAPIFQSVEGYRASELPLGVRLLVVGPDPYRDRRWYATVELIDGKVEVS